MGMRLAEQVRTAVAEYADTNRLYDLTVQDAGGDGLVRALLVEAFSADDEVQAIGGRDVIVLSTSIHIACEELLGRQAALEISLADGTRTRFAGEVNQVALLGSDGGLARYRVRIVPWMWRLGEVRNSRVWQDKSVIDIVDSVFAAYLPLAKWRWSDDARAFMGSALPRSYCCQYRESDLDFVLRLLSEEGLCWRFEQTDDGPCAVLFADSSQPCAVPEDESSACNPGVRYHGARSVEQSDTVQAITAQRRLHASLATVLGYDHKSRQIVAAGTPAYACQGRSLPPLEAFDLPGRYACASREQARRYADLWMQAKEARSQLWHGRGTVRTLRAGTRLNLTGLPLRQMGETASFTILRVRSVGVNNLPPPAQQGLAELFGPIPELLDEVVQGNWSGDFAAAIRQAQESGYANCFEAIPSELTWRPELPGSDGRSRSKPTAHGAQSAIVIGPNGRDTPSGTDELYCDRLGRVRIRFHWQDSGTASCWVRVAQRSAGTGMGNQFLPRIGQEVFVQFLENDIDQPIIVGAMYNGQGEGGIVPTPGGQVREGRDVVCFRSAHDHAPSAQGNRAGGNSPVWHGASGDSGGHRNGAAQWGVRSKEFGGLGYNQLLFDDTDGQGRVQLKCSHEASELNLGHLIHAADNYRGSFRGLGAELRTDAYGAVRAGAGLLVTSYSLQNGSATRDPIGENAAGLAMLTQAARLAGTLHAAASTHQTVGLASHAGAAGSDASVLDDKAAPLKAMVNAASGMVGSASLDAAQTDAANRNTSQDTAKLPHFTDPIIAMSARDGLGVNAGLSLQLANGETTTLMSGQDMQFVAGGQMRVHAGQAIGVLGGAVKAGAGGLGLQLIAAKDAIDIQAQADELKVQARDEIDVISANAHIDWAAAKKISLSTAGGANITIEGGNITVQCPGKIVVHAGKKSFLGPDKLAYPMPALPSGICVECLKKALAAGSAFTMVQ